MLPKGLVIYLSLLTSGLVAEDKWVWEKNSREAKVSDNDDLRASPRYETFEPSVDYEYERPLRPRPNQVYPGGPGFTGGFASGPVYGGRPQGILGALGALIGSSPQRPSGPGFGGALSGPGYYPNPNLDPGFNGIGGRPPFKRFDTCSCTERFNCQSPGLAYGHCDVGKSYCCFNKHGGVDVGPAPSRPIESPANGILVGPTNGGDFGYGHHDGQAGFNENSLYRPGDQGQDILVGPGGPTGIIGRPGLRPVHSAANGILVGPGGPYDRPYGSYGGAGGYNRPPPPVGLYGRSAPNEEDQPGKNQEPDNPPTTTTTET